MVAPLLYTDSMWTAMMRTNRSVLTRLLTVLAIEKVLRVIEALEVGKVLAVATAEQGARHKAGHGLPLVCLRAFHLPWTTGQPVLQFQMASALALVPHRDRFC